VHAYILSFIQLMYRAKYAKNWMFCVQLIPIISLNNLLNQTPYIP
jgi:hypothetical protein